MNRILWLTLPCFALAGCNQAPPPPVDNAVANSINAAEAEPTSAPITDATTYLAKAGASDLFEIESSEAIAGKTSNPEIKAFAEMMVKDHTQSSAILQAAARKARIITTAPALEPAQEQALNRVKTANGVAAESAYLDAQRTGHSEALALHSGYAVGGDTEQLKAAANEITPVIQHHIDQLAKITIPGR